MIMNKKRNVLIGLAALAVAVLLALGLVLTRDDNGAGDAAAEGVANAPAQGEREILYWRAPMNPNEIYEQPGKSRMGMDLVPVYADEASGEGVVSIDAVTTQNIGVRTAPAVVASLDRTVRTTGRFAVNEQRTAVVSPKIGGWVEDLHVNFEGARVRKGQPLLEIYSPELVSTQEEYLLALRNAERLGGGADAQRLVDAARRRLAFWDITDEQIKRLEQTGTPTRTLTLYAPASGTVAETNVIEGQKIMPGMALMKLSDLSVLWLMVDVYEQDLSWVGVGTRAVIELPYEPGKTINGVVDYLYDELDAGTRTVKARVRVANPGLKLKPSMYATVRLVGGRMAPTVLVPSEAVVRSGDQAIVIIALGDGRFRPADVEVGAESEGRVQILSGLTGDEQVVTSAQFLIDSEARLASAVNAMAGKGGAQADSAPVDAGMEKGAGMDTPAAAAPSEEDGVQVARINITPQGFEPATVSLKKGVPARLVFTRHTENTCATEVVIPDFGIEATPLPLHKEVTLKLTPKENGTFTFACGMDMLKGTIVVNK